MDPFNLTATDPEAKRPRHRVVPLPVVRADIDAVRNRIEQANARWNRPAVMEFEAYIPPSHINLASPPIEEIPQRIPIRARILRLEHRHDCSRYQKRNHPTLHGMYLHRDPIPDSFYPFIPVDAMLSIK